MTRKISAIIAVFMVAGCATMAGTFCDVARPIRPSVDDQMTDSLKRQILAHDETGERLCGWRP